MAIAEVHVNVTYPGGSEAAFVDVHIYNEDLTYDSFGALHSSTNGTGRCIVYIDPANLGPCIITVHNSTKTNFVSENVYIGPGDRIFRDIILEEALPYDIVIEGHVLDASSWFPTPPLTIVQASGFDEEGKDFLVENNTDNNGFFNMSVPYSVKPVNILVWVSNLSKNYRGHSSQIFLRKDRSTNMLSLEMTPVDHPTVPVNVRFIDGTTGKPFNDPLMCSITGKAWTLDHTEEGFGGVTTTLSSGWLNDSLSPGEYIYTCTYVMYWPVMNYLTFDIPVYVNDTGFEGTYQISLPSSMRSVNITFIDSETLLPVPMVRCSFSYLLKKAGYPEMRFSNGNILSNATGVASFGILPGTEVRVLANNWEYQEEGIVIEPGPASSDVIRTVELVKSPPIVVMNGNLSLLVRDSVSLRPLPLVNIQGTPQTSGHPTFFYGQTDINGYFNSSLSAGFYTIDAHCSLGSAHVEDISVVFKQNITRTIDLARRDFAQETNYLEFKVTDPSGFPLAGKPLILMSDLTGDVLQMVSDKQGMIRANLMEGDHWLSTYEATYASNYRPHWIVPQGTKVTVESGVSYGEIVLYPAEPLEEISGVVTDIDTGDAIPYAHVQSRSKIDLPGPAPDEPFAPYEVVVYEQDVLTGQKGFYRVWGIGESEIEFSAEGYFPLVDGLDAPLLENDVEMEKLEPYSTWVNGTLLDESDAPVRGNVTLFDLDRGEFMANTTKTGADGKFSLGIYPGNFRVEFHNLSLMGSMEIEVPATGVEDLVLRLIALSHISGTVKDRKGNQLGSINITLEKVEHDGDWEYYSIYSYYISDQDGTFQFEAPKGVYRLYFNGNSLYDPYEGQYLVINGWTDIEVDIILENRTRGDISGHVLGNASGTFAPILGSEVFLKDDQGIIVDSKVCSPLQGSFDFKDVPFGNYSLYAALSEDTMAVEHWYIDGYLPNETQPFTVGSQKVEIDMVLDLITYSPPGYFDLDAYSPADGAGVPLDEPLRLWFSEPVNMTELPGAMVISPAPDNITFVASWDGKAVCIYHSGFAPSTRYDVTLLPRVLSMAGSPIRDRSPIEWNFTTGTGSGAWGIYSSLITIYPNKNWSVRAVGPTDQKVFLIVKDVGSFKLWESERTNSTSFYIGSLDGVLFNWSTLYFFHYSNVESGPDMAVEFSGYRMMPYENITPVPEWKLFHASVRLDVDGNWLVNATGNANITVYIVIEDTGSFLLGQVDEGEYLAEIPYATFEGGREYDYHFSNASGGLDLAPSLSGTLKAMERGDGEGKGISTLAWLLIVLAVVLLILAVLAFVIAVSSRKDMEEDVEGWKEEEEDWGME